MRVGNLVKYVGCATTYRDRIGIVTRLYGISACPERIDSAMVHFAGLEGKGRDEACAGQVQNGLHPMALDELEVLNDA